MAATKSKPSISLYAHIALLLLLLLMAHHSSATRVLLPNEARPDPAQQAQTAIASSLSTARGVSALVSSMAKSGRLRAREAAAVNDCIVTVGASVDELARALKAMKSGARSEMKARVEDVQTWVSAAMTDESTCMDGLEGVDSNGEEKRRIRGEIVRLAQLISNALALLRRLNI